MVRGPGPQRGQPAVAVAAAGRRASRQQVRTEQRLRGGTMRPDDAVRRARLQKIMRSLSGAAPPPALTPGTASSAAVVATVKGVSASTLGAWCNYHLAIGFKAIFVYFDDPMECHAFN